MSGISANSAVAHRAVVIGAGVGGLTAALALQRRGWEVTVYERADALEDVGAGLAVAPNALRLLDRLGVGERVRALSAMQGAAGIRRPSGRWLSRTTVEAATARFGDPTVVLRRAELVSALAGALAPGTVRFGATVTDVDPDGGEVAVGGAVAAAALVVAADGINSGVREKLLPGHPGAGYAGVTSWRLLAPRPSTPVSSGETWGRGTVFGVTPLADGGVYAYATAVAAPGGRAGDGGAEDERAELLRRFAGWHEPIPQLIASAHEVLRTDIRRLAAPLPRLHAGRVALLGDAAHAMTPNLGQGACQAIEDGYVLASLAGEPDGLARYSAARLPRTTDIARRSWRITRLTRVSHPAPVLLRDGGLWLASAFGPGVILRQMAPVLGWRPEGVAGARAVAGQSQW